MAVIRPSLPQLAYTMVPNAWVRDPELPPPAKAYLVYLLSHAEGFRCSTSLAARDMGVGRDTVSGWNRKLIALGYFVAVRQVRRGSGQWAENDYTITDHTHGVPPRPLSDNPTLPLGELSDSPRTAEPDTVQPDTVNPGLRRQGREDQGSPTETPPTHLAQTVTARARDLAREHYEATGGLAKFPAVQSIVKRALSAARDGTPLYDDEQVRDALRQLRDHGRPVTLETIRSTLERSQTVGGSSYRRAAGPYRDPSAPGAFDGGF